jgi:hypothetical protein
MPTKCLPNASKMQVKCSKMPAKCQQNANKRAAKGHFIGTIFQATSDDEI